MSLRQEAISGIGWTGTSRIGRQVLSFAIIVVLARLLTPQDFGLAGMIVVFTGFAGLFSEAGFGAALIQRKEIEERHLSSVFWLNIAIGAGLMGLAILAAPGVADFFDEPLLESLMCLMALNLMITPFGVVPAALLRRSLNFRVMTIVEIAAMTVSGGVAIVLALTGFGVWTLVWRGLLSSACGALGLWIASEWRPKLLFRRKAVRELLNFSGNLLGFSSFNYWVRNADNLLIGKLVGSTGLGIYTRAYGTMLLPIRQITSVIGKVMFPALSKIQGDTERVKRAYLRATRAIGLITIPMMVGLFVVADSFVLATFGPKWTAVIPVLRVLSLVGITQPIGSTVGWLYLSQGRADWQFKWGVGSGLFRLSTFAIGVNWGVMGVAFAYLLGTCVLWYPSIAIPGRLINLSVARFARNLGGVFCCSALMAGAVWTTSVFLLASWPHLVALGVEVVVGVGVYWLALEVFDVRAYSEMRGLLRGQWQRFRGAAMLAVAE